MRILECVALALLLAGCTALPPCPAYVIKGVVVDGKLYGIIDRPNLEKMAARDRGLVAGECNGAPQ